MKVVVLCGGFSEEQDTSRKSAQSVASALETLGHEVVTVEYDEDVVKNIKDESPDVVFHIVQGKYHGDGAVQALLELIGVPYTGSRPQEAAMINHKTICKKIWRAAGIPTPEFFEYSYTEYKSDSFSDFEAKVKAAGLTIPVVVKPPTQGARFGMVFVKDSDTFKELENSFSYDRVLLVERYVKGRFFTQGVIEINGNMTALPPVEVVDPSDDEFKRFYKGITSKEHNFTPEQLSEINRITLDATHQVGASGIARLDYHLSDGKLYLLEINAVPGLTLHFSSIIDCAAAAGYDYNTFIGMILATAIRESRDSHKISDKAFA